MTQTLSDKAIQHTAIEWLVRLQSPQLTAAQREAFQSWLNQKQEHQRAYIEAERHWERLAVLENLGSDTENTGPEIAAVPLQKSNIAGRSGPWYQQRPRALAATVTALLLALVVQMWSTIDNGAHYQTQTGEQHQFTLADGTDIHLNTRSSVRVKLEEKQRIVQLEKGEIFFNVHSDSKRPFIVETPRGLVHVLGTRFNVRTTESETTITVIEGRVSVAQNITARALAAKNYVSDTTLTDNQQIILSANPAEYTPQTIDAKATTTWRQGKQVYNGERFANVVKDLNRYYTGEIKLGDPALENIEVVAVIDLLDRASAIAALESTFHLLAVVEPTGETVLYPIK